VFVLLDKVIDPQNFGSIIRTSAFYGVDKLIVNKKSRPSLSPAVINVSAGATELIDIYDLKHFKSFVQGKAYNLYK
jgi:tRNA G18 (ribose-2'-O)-methylase SpoU